MKRLTELGIKHHTDKAYLHSFTEIYDDYFKNYKSPRILELGVYNGGSLEMLNEYFNYESDIIGVDNWEGMTYKPSTSNVSVIDADQEYPDDLASKIQGMFDIIIDDGSHIMHHQIKCFEALQNRVKPGGIYIIEDLHTSFESSFNPKNTETCIQFLKKLDSNRPNYIKSITIFSDVELEAATIGNHVTSIIQF